ncbi:hypothetical protein AK812_SmicGene5521 [Symbiodinium microadriaticum]|uniref:Uncharacterized protein n=1 Tax=Symbiodinium microadriaticum TaxID=2951 RepID=A0A1Q9ETF7_SYMMI|nr:hypothetical protein AK812_SmicGene5521 [Symbiodinium microadriaticum]
MTKHCDEGADAKIEEVQKSPTLQQYMSKGSKSGSLIQEYAKLHFEVEEFKSKIQTAQSGSAKNEQVAAEHRKLREVAKDECIYGFELKDRHVQQDPNEANDTHVQGEPHDQDEPGSDNSSIQDVVVPIDESQPYQQGAIRRSLDDVAKDEAQVNLQRIVAVQVWMSQAELGKNGELGKEQL